MRKCVKEAEGADPDATILVDVHVYRNGSQHKTLNDVQIGITREEKALFDLLKECVAFHSLDLELRVAGGWVRDKLLKVTSKDIDIALEKLTGVEFCDYLNKYTEHRLGFQKSVGILKRRPEQSKHLETATLNILGFDVDFVNLRSEDYAQDSRIPVMKIGTPMEDAMRRDFTINALFYNISKNAIEDYTGKGLDDLSAEVIRACSSAFVTFMDDPLRVIRAIRFSSRLGYRLDSEIIDASSHPQVLKQFQNKVARPRIAQELDDMLAKGNTAKAFELMNEFGILAMLTKENQYGPPTHQQIDVGCKTMELIRDCLQSPDWEPIDRRLAFLAAFCAPFKDEFLDEKCSFVSHVVKARFKLPNKMASGAHTIVEGADRFGEIVWPLPTDTADLRELLGMTIRNIGPLWKEALLLSMAKELLRDQASNPFVLHKKYANILETIYKLELQETYLLRAPITGKELMDLMPEITPGPRFKEALDIQVKHLVRMPLLSKETLLQYVVKEFNRKLSL